MTLSAFWTFSRTAGASSSCSVISRWICSTDCLSTVRSRSWLSTVHPPTCPFSSDWSTWFIWAYVGQSTLKPFEELSMSFRLFPRSSDLTKRRFQLKLVTRNCSRSGLIIRTRRSLTCDWVHHWERIHWRSSRPTTWGSSHLFKRLLNIVRLSIWVHLKHPLLHWSPLVHFNFQIVNFSFKIPFIQRFERFFVRSLRPPRFASSSDRLDRGSPFEMYPNKVNFSV